MGVEEEYPRMLKSMRTNVKSLSFTLWLVIAAFIGTTFLVWGIRSTPGGGMARAGVIAQMDKEQISVDEFRDAYHTLFEHYRRSLGDKFDEEAAERMKLKQKVLDDLVHQRLILVQARKMGIEITGDDLGAMIKDIPAFQENGQFSKKQYLAVLQYNRLNPQKYEQSLRMEAIITKMQDLIKEGAKVSDLEAKNLLAMANNRAKVEFVELLMKDYPKENAEALTTKFQESGGWGRTIAENKMKLQKTDYLFYNAPFSGVPDPVPFIKAAFSLKQGEVSSLVEGKERYYVMRAIEVKSGDDKDLKANQTDLLRNQIQLQKRDVFLKEWIAALKRGSKLQIEESLLK